MALIKRVVMILELEAYNVLQNNGALAGQTVFHAHFHLIPKRHDGEGLLPSPPPPQSGIASLIKERVARPGT